MELENCFYSNLVAIDNIVMVKRLNKYKYEAVLEWSQKFGDIVINDFTLSGSSLEEKCKKCSSKLIYYGIYEAKFCPECNEWTEKNAVIHFVSFALTDLKNPYQ